MFKMSKLLHQGGCCGGHDDPNHVHGSCGGGCSGCGCGGHNGLPESEKNPLEVHITPKEEEFLQKLAQTPFLPVAQYLLTSKESEHITNAALSPVFLETGKETVAEIKAVGHVLLDLEERSIISLDFDSPLEGTDESVFYDSDSFALLKETVEEGKAKEEFIFHAPSIQFGSVCLTALGDLIIDQLDFL